MMKRRRNKSQSEKDTIAKANANTNQTSHLYHIPLVLSCCDKWMIFLYLHVVRFVLVGYILVHHVRWVQFRPLTLATIFLTSCARARVVTSNTCCVSTTTTSSTPRQATGRPPAGTINPPA